MKVDTSMYQKNRSYYSNLYKSMRSADISHSDILAVYGNPYINAATNWNIMLYQKQRSIRNQYPGIDNVAKSISSIKYDFANVLSKTTPEVRQFVKQTENTITIRPKITFKQVLEQYGYPVISKEVAKVIEENRRNPEGYTKKKFDKKYQILHFLFYFLIFSYKYFAKIFYKFYS